MFIQLGTFKFKVIVLAIIAIAAFGKVANGQTTVFTDDFNRASLSPGGTPSMTYSSTLGGTTTGSITASTYLTIHNGTSANVSYITGPTSTFSSPYNTTLSSNCGLITWTFNFRYERTSDPAAPVSGSYGTAVVLGGTSSNFTTCNGYAVVYGNSGTPDPIRLVRFSGGVDGTLTDIISSGASDISAINNYVSVRVTYNPTGNNWSLYLRDDGGSAWVDPSSGVTNQIGSTTSNSTYTGSALTNFGFFWTGGTSNAAANTVDFDNFKVVLSGGSPTITSQPSTTTQSLCQNATSSALSVTATSATSYAWYSNASNSNSGGTVIGGATSSSYTPPTTSAGTIYYYCIVTGCTGTVTSSVSGAVTVTAAPATPATPTAAVSPACSGTTLAALGSPPAGVTYYWQGTNSSGTSIVDTADIVYNVSSSGTYYANAQNGTSGCWSSSSSVAVTIVQPPVITSEPTDVSSCSATSITFSVVASNAASYQWQVSTGGAFSNLSNGAPYSGVTTATLTINPTAAGLNGYQYQCIAKATSPCSDDFSNAATLTISSTAPTTNATSPTISNLGCNTFKLTCTKGNGSNRLIVVKSGSAPTAPTNGVSYTANAIFGSGGTTAAGSYVVYNGTGNSVSVSGLTASTTYYYAIYEFTGCGSTYLLTGTIASGNTTTTSCSVPIGILGINIDACGGSCGYEGNNELIWGYTGSYGWQMSTSNPVIVKYNSTTPPTTTYISTFNSSSTNTTTMNTAVSSCGTTTFYDAISTGFIPPFSHFVIANNCMCSPAAYDFSNLCGQGPIYVLYGNNSVWPCNGSGGIFGNHSSSGGIRYISFDFTTNIPSSSVDIINYNSNTLPSGNGAYATWAITGGAQTSYGTGACTIPIIILPIELTNFGAQEKGNTIQVNWTTTSEKNVNSFTIEKSLNGADFYAIGNVRSLNNELGGNYQFIDESPSNGINYYRLKTIDINSEEEYSSPIEVNYNGSGNYLIYQSYGNLQVVAPKNAKIGIIDVYSITGQLMKSISIIENSTLTIPGGDLKSGVYFIRITSGNSSVVKKVFIE